MQYCSWENSQSACSSWAQHRSQSLGVRQGFRRLQQSLRRLRRPFLSWVAGYPDAHVQLLRFAGRFKWEKKTTSAATMQLKCHHPAHSGTICTIPSELQSAVQKSHQVPSIIQSLNQDSCPPWWSLLPALLGRSRGPSSSCLTILAKDGMTGMTGMTMKTT